MKFSQFFSFTRKEAPKEAQILSHQLMLRANMIHQTNSGIYSWLPLGLRVLQKVEAVIRKEMNLAGAQEIIMPTIQPADLWLQSGRYEAYGKEMLRIKDRHDRDMLYGPTAEEVVTDIARSYLKSYRDLPHNLYQIHWKFRDEIRPRFGVMRGREFLMKDAYTFDLNFDLAQKSYALMFDTYLRIFNRMNLNAIPVRADSGAIGGDLSHEFHVVADTGESGLYYDRSIENIRDQGQLTIDVMRNLYAASDEMYKPDECPVAAGDLVQKRGIEVGHVFYLGTKYSQAMGLALTGEDGAPFYPHMGCFGIGVSRVVGALIEANHDDQGIIWPLSVAPFHVGLINMNTSDATATQVCNELYGTLHNAGIEVLYDDRDIRGGAKFADMDLIGVPYHITIGPRDAAQGMAEFKDRRTGAKQTLSLDALMNHVTSIVC